MKRALLSPREEEVATLIAEDLADKEIASILRISIRTVQQYLDRIGEKLECKKSQRARRRVIRAWVNERDRVGSIADRTAKAS